MADPRSATVVLGLDVAAARATRYRAVAALREAAGISAVVARRAGDSLVVEFDPARTSVTAVVGCLTANGLPPIRARVVGEDPATSAG